MEVKSQNGASNNAFVINLRSSILVRQRSIAHLCWYYFSYAVIVFWNCYKGLIIIDCEWSIHSTMFFCTLFRKPLRNLYAGKFCNTTFHVIMSGPLYNACVESLYFSFILNAKCRDIVSNFCYAKRYELQAPTLRTSSSG